MKIISFIAILLLSLTAGCASRQRAVEFYVDAVSLKEQNEDQQAIRKLNQAIKTDRQFSLAHSLLGEIYEHNKEYPQAASAYRYATELNPWSFKDYFSLGRVYQTMKDFAEAVNAYKKASELKPDHFEANFNTAKCLYEVNDFDQALAYGKKAEKIDPNIFELQMMLGGIYETQKNYESSIRSFKRALELDSNNTSAKILLAVGYLRTGRYEPARELLSAVINLQPDNGTAHQYLGFCFLRLEDVRQAIANYEKAIEINNLDWEAYRGLGVAYMLDSLKNNDSQLKSKAVELWRKSLSIKPDQPRSDRLIKLIEKYSK